MASYSIKNTIYALAALAIPAAGNLEGTQQGVGFATVTNKCGYDVYVSNVPAEHGGFDAQSYTLKANSGNDPYKFQYTKLSNDQGWSIKLSKNEGQFGSNIMQFETTFHDDGTIWWDLSGVDGNPWAGNWKLSTSGDDNCEAKQQAYRNPTDNEWGMQAGCAQKANTHVELCSSNNTDSSGSDPETGSGSSSAPEPPAASSPVTETFVSAPVGSSATFSAPSHSASLLSALSWAAPVPSSPSAFSAAPLPSTLQTVANIAASSAAGDFIATVTQSVGTTVVVTQTATPQKKRSEEEEHALAHEHIKRHQEEYHHHHGHF
ncbi:MAG: hypothetical protein M1820_010417 [Bogoriella megaspora]|nr:MAG: hypothetical protein M1820_010417 [Bogoriella megaspora]